MKRKDCEDVHHDFHFPSLSRKSRRLDAELLPSIEEDPITEVPPVPNQLDPSDAPPIDATPSSDEKALVLYNPSSAHFLNSSASIPFVKSPTSPDLSIIVDSDLIPGLRDHIFWRRNCKTFKAHENEASADGECGESNDCMAVVPWVAPQLPLASETEMAVAGPAEPMEEDAEVEMMEIEDGSTEKVLQYGQTREGTEGLQLWQQQQQHCMMPQVPQNISTPITW